MVRFDAYSATTQEASASDLVALLIEGESVGSLSMQQGRGFHTFGQRLAVHHCDRGEIGAVMWGGRQGDRVMLEVKGDRSPSVVERLRERVPHRCTRVDACADFDASRAFERLLSCCMRVKRAHRLKGSRAGDWQDFPEEGRTQYLGSEKSPVRLRLYEKGKQPEYRHLKRANWVRIEAQVRPTKDAKAVFSTLSPLAVWGASAWTREIAAAVLMEHVEAHPAGTVWKHSEREAALRWMCKQYGGHLVSLAADLGGWECVGLTLREVIAESRGRGGRA